MTTLDSDPLYYNHFYPFRMYRSFKINIYFKKTICMISSGGPHKMIFWAKIGLWALSLTYVICCDNLPLKNGFIQRWVSLYMFCEILLRCCDHFNTLLG